MNNTSNIKRRGLLGGIGGGCAFGLLNSSPASAALFNASVNTSYYTFIDQAFTTDRRQVSFRFPSTTITASTPGVFASGVQQLTASGIFQLLQSDTVSWNAVVNSAQVGSQYASIQPFEHNLTGTSMASIFDGQKSVIGNNYSLSYGFYNAQLGMPGFLRNLFDSFKLNAPGSIPANYQLYSYLTDNYTSWMGSLVAAQPILASQPFSTFVLPGAHDAGMNDGNALSSLIGNRSQLAGVIASLQIGKTTLGNALLGSIGAGAVQNLPSSMLMRILRNVAFTQKDSISTMLGLGVRYFDFRPGYTAGTSDRTLYHQHKVLPGLSYLVFLNTILAWLKANPSEVVVVSLSSSGFGNDSQIPTPGALAATLTTAQNTTQSGVRVGNKASLALTYNALTGNNTRLIFLNNVGASDDATNYNCYSDAVYQTTDIATIVNALKTMTGAGQSGSDYTVLQLQSTPIGTESGLYVALTGSSDATSPNMAMKASVDQATLPWVRSTLARTFGASKLTVLLNDFADNALTSAAIYTTLQRSQLRG